MNFVLFLGILLILGLASTRLMKVLKMPVVTGYLIVGLIAAIVCLIIDGTTDNDHYFAKSLTTLNSFVSTVALGFIALSIGEEFRLSKIKAFGTKITIITFVQALAAAILVDLVLVFACIFLHLNVSIAICLGAIATATAPAATIMVINQYKAKGPLVDILLPVVAFDDAIGLVVFAISTAIGKVLVTGEEISIISIVLIPLFEIFGSLGIGFVLGIIMHFVIKIFTSRHNHSITIIAFTLLGVGICELINTFSINGEPLEFSNLLCCMMIGAVYINFAGDTYRPTVYRDFELIDRWTPFLFMLFFVLSGAHLATSAQEILSTSEITILVPILIIFGCYLIFRSLGKYFGSFFACKYTKQQKTITDYLGVTLLPQAGVAIGMANQISGMSEFQTDNIGNIIVTVVLCATLVYELVGPLLTKWALEKAGEIPHFLENVVNEKDL